jgi:tripartite-type tricarboxylate transporter receptor subunit TctC
MPTVPAGQPSEIIATGEDAMSAQVGIPRRRVSAWLAAAAVLPFLPTGRAAAQAGYPSRLVKIIVPWPAGAITDMTARLLANQWSTEFGQAVVVENKAGASGTVGHTAVAHSPPDGYTVLFATNSTYAVAPSILPSLPYDNDKAFAPVGLVLRSPQMLCVNPSVPVNTVPELLDYVRKRQANEVNFSSAGPGSTSHMAMELLMSMAQIRMQHVPYRGGAPSLQGLVAGETSVGFVDLSTAIPVTESGQLRMIGASTTERIGLRPDLATIAETVPGFQSSTDVAMFVPAGTPEPIIRRLNTAMKSALLLPQVTKPLLQVGLILIGGAPEEFPRYFAEECGKWRRLVETQNIKLQ